MSSFFVCGLAVLFIEVSKDVAKKKCGKISFKNTESGAGERLFAGGSQGRGSQKMDVLISSPAPVVALSQLFMYGFYYNFNNLHFRN